MSRQKKLVFGSTLLYMAISYLMNVLIYKLYGYDVYIQQLYKTLMSGNLETVPVLPTPPLEAVLIVLAINIVTVVVGIGYTGCMLKASRGEDFSFKCLMDGFEFFFKGLAIQLISACAIVLGLVLFIIPGIVFACMFSAAIFVMFDNPGKGVFWCLGQSARIMKGRKKGFVMLILSFLPLILLNELVAMLFLPVLDIWVMPYMEISRAVFYNDAAGLLQAENEENIDN